MLKNLVQIDRIVDVKRSQQRENIGLNGAYQQLKQRNTDHKNEAGYRHHRGHPNRVGVQAVDDESRQYFHQYVACGHGNE